MFNGKPLILVVEDQALIRMGAVDLVVFLGYEALEAQGADQAIRILESRTDIDLVFTDVEVPGTMDGIMLSHRIRTRWPRIGLIVASGRAVFEADCLPPGSLFFSKPYSVQAITEAMALMLSDARRW